MYLNKSLHKEPSPGPSSTSKIFLGLPIYSQKATHHTANISPKRFEIKGAVIKSPPFAQKDFASYNNQIFCHKEQY